MLQHSVKRVAEQLRSRMGRFIPKERHPEWLPQEGLGFTCKDVVVTSIDADNDADVNGAKRFMRSNFYRDAPIPTALRLSDGGPHIDAFVEKEMDVFLGSGNSLQFRRAGELVGVGFFATWARDDDYETVDADVFHWHNAAALLAREVAAERGVDPRITWRDLQYQHIYNLSQRALRARPDRQGVVWAAALSYGDIKAMGVTEVLLTDSTRNMTDAGLMLGLQSNFPGFHRAVLTHVKNATLVDEMRYVDEQLEVDGEQVFKTLAQCETIRFYFNEPLELSAASV